MSEQVSRLPACKSSNKKKKKFSVIDKSFTPRKIRVTFHLYSTKYDNIQQLSLPDKKKKYAGSIETIFYFSNIVIVRKSPEKKRFLIRRDVLIHY